MVLKIGHLQVEPPLILAPMADHTHAAFRELVAHFGGCGLFFTEMLNSRIVATQKLSTDPYLMRAKRDRPLAAQMAGRDPDRIARALERIRGCFEAYDLNMGCARGVVQRYRWGVWLMEDKGLAAEVVRRAREVVQGPLTVKVRSGVHQHDLKYLKDFCLMLEAEGVDAVLLHPRTARERLKRPPRWEEIRAVKAALSIPVIGNGDVFGPEDALRMFAETDCDGVMIGRAALIRPWIFRDSAAALRGEEIPPPPDPLEVVEVFYTALRRYCPEELRVERLLDFCFWFLQNWPFALHYWREVRRAGGLERMVEKLKALLREAGPLRPYPVRPFMVK